MPNRLSRLVLGALLTTSSAQAMAQSSRGSDYGFTPPPGVPVTPWGQGGQGLIPPVQDQYRAARNLSEDGSIRRLLNVATDAMMDRNWARANAALGRAEVSLLNHMQLAGRTAQNEDTLDYLNDAREALRDGNPRAARRAAERALMAWDGGSSTVVRDGQMRR